MNLKQVKVTDAFHNFFSSLPDSWVKRTIFASLMVANGSRPSNTCPFGHGSEISERQPEREREREREREGKRIKREEKEEKDKKGGNKR